VCIKGRKEEMQQQPETGTQGFAQQRVIAALTSLSSLALETSMLRFSSPKSVQRLTMVFLDQLVMLCEAQQGALFVMYHPLPPEAANVWDALLAYPPQSLIASTHISAEEAQTVLSSAVPVPTDTREWLEDTSHAMRWTRSLDASFSHGVSADTASFPVISQYSAVLLFTWPVADQATRRMQCQAIHLLPFLADLVDTILLHILPVLHEDQQPGEVFPTELLATVGHEFRGPLTTIQGYATTLLRHNQRLTLEEHQDFLHAINEASTHLGKLVERFLELAQLEAHAHAFMSGAINVWALAQESITALQKSRPHRLLLDPPLAPQDTMEGDRNSEAFRDTFILSGDRRLLRIMLDMLLENAVAYSTSESLVEVSMETFTTFSAFTALHTPSSSGTHLALILPARFQEQESLIAIRIRDHGIGISPEHLALIFRRFYRVDSRLTRDVNGLGLGLALCKAIVALHRGMLWVESAVGEGSTFSVVLPRGRASSMDEPTETYDSKERLGYHQ
jgi:signal transduction histidine kinase